MSPPDNRDSGERHDSDRPTQPDLSKPRCPECHGEKHTRHVVERGTGYSTQSSPCKLCHGKGWVDIETYRRWELGQRQ